MNPLWTSSVSYASSINTVTTCGITCEVVMSLSIGLLLLFLLSNGISLSRLFPPPRHLGPVHFILPGTDIIYITDVIFKYICKLKTFCFISLKKCFPMMWHYERLPCEVGLKPTVCFCQGSCKASRSQTNSVFVQAPVKRVGLKPTVCFCPSSCKASRIQTNSVFVQAPVKRVLPPTLKYHSRHQPSSAIWSYVQWWNYTALTWVFLQYCTCFP